jgi:hypothetical protein
MYKQNKKPLKFNQKGHTHYVIMFIAVALIAAVGVRVLTASHAATVPIASTVTTNGECTTTASLQRVQTITATGAVAANYSAAATIANSTSLAKEYVYNLNGSEIDQIVPPSGWSPLTATAQQLQTYGFPAKPTDATTLASWNAAMASYKSSPVGGFCNTNKKYALVSTLRNDAWTGAVALNNAKNQNLFDEASASWHQAGLNKVCGIEASYATWVGLGGDDSSLTGTGGQDGLIQDGTDVDYNASNSHPATLYAWWETLNNTYGNAAIAFWGSYGHIHPGDNIYDWVHYSGGKVSFLVMDLTDGQNWSATLSSLRAVPMSELYNGHTADYITEAGSDNNGQTDLAEPNSNTTQFDNSLLANDSPITSYRTQKAEETSQTGGYANTTNFNGSSNSMTNTWKKCR